MSARGALQVLLSVVLLLLAASPPARSQSVSLDLADLSYMNTRVVEWGYLVIEEVSALDPSGYWYRHPWGYEVWDIQFKKSGSTGFIGYEGCLSVANNPWASQPLHAFNGRLMRSGPTTSGTYVATLITDVVLHVPGFASRPACLRFLTFGSHGGASNYTITLTYETGAPATIVVPIADAGVYPRDGSGAGWLTQAVTGFVSSCTGWCGDMVEITNPRPGADLSSAVIAYDTHLSGPIAVSLSLSETDYLAGYQFMGFAWSGSDQASALRAPGGTVTWEGIDWSATMLDSLSEIIVRMYCGEAGTGGSVLWQYAGEFTLAPGSGSADLAQPCSGEFVRCEIDMVAGLDVSPMVDSLRFRYAGPAAVGDEGQRPRVLLGPNAPNPFRSTTSLRFELPCAGPAWLALYDISGRLIRMLMDADLSAGVHWAMWDGRDGTGRPVPPGSYVAKLEALGDAATVRVKLVR